MNNDEQHTQFTSSQHHHPNGSNYESLAAKKRKNLQTQPPNSSKKSKLTDPFLTKIDQIMQTLKTTNKKPKKRGRPKGSKKKPNPEITTKFAQASLFYALGQHQKSIPLLKQVILLAPNFSEAYHTLGLIYEQTGDKKTATDFFMLAAHLAPKGNAELWKRIVALSLQMGNTSQAIHCLSKAIKADPSDVGLRLDRAGFHVEFGEYLKAAKAYRAVLSIRPDNVYARKMAANMYHKCNRVENSISILEEYVKGQSGEGEKDISVVYLLASFHMEKGNYRKALEMIEYVGKFQKEIPAHLKVLDGICQIRLGKVEDAEVMFRDLQMECLEDAADYVTKIADALMDLGRHEVALKYYSMIEGNDGEKGPLYCKIAHCYQSLMKRAQAIEYLYKALQTEEDNTDARLTLASLLIEEEKEDEAISVLSPPKNLESTSCTSKPWWVNVEVKLELAKIYHGKGMTEEFVGAIFPFINETLMVESSNRKVRKKNKLTRSILSERVKVLDDNHTDSVFRHRPKLAPCELQKAVRAKKALEKKAALEDTDHSDDEF